MNSAVIVACGRSAIGRARKGSLIDVRPDDLAAHVVTKVLAQVPQLDRSEIEAGEGDVFLSVGVECVSRYGGGYPDAPDTYNPRLVPGNPDEYPDVYITMGQTAENVARREKISREEQDRYAVKSQNAAVKARDNGFFDREIIPVPLP